MIKVDAIQKRFQSSFLRVILFFVLVIVHSQFAFCVEKADVALRTVKVGYYSLTGFYEYNQANSYYTGYNCEYLSKIASIAGWNLEYVVAPYDKCLSMVETGEVDIVCVLTKEPDRNRFDFPNLVSGFTFSTLVTSSTNTRLIPEDYQEYNGLKIGVVSGNDATIRFDSFAKQNGFSYVKAVYATQAMAFDGLNRGECDAILTIQGGAEMSRLRVLARFEPLPLYLYLKKGNAVLLEELNVALDEMSLKYDKFRGNLVKKYNLNYNVKTTDFTKAEREFIQKSDPVRVVIDPEILPIEGFNAKTGVVEGFTPRLFNQIALKSGLRFEFVRTGSFEESKQTVIDGKAEIFSTCTKPETDFPGYPLSEPYLDIPRFYVGRANGILNKARPIVALSDRSGNYEKHIKWAYPNASIMYCASLDDCFAAVSSGKADLTLQNLYTSQYLIQTRYNNLVLLGQSAVVGPYRFVFSMHTTPALASIVNKCIEDLTDSDVNNMMFSAITDLYDKKPPLLTPFTLGVIGVSLVLFGLLVITALLLRRLSKQKNQLNQALLWERELEQERVIRTMRDSMFESVSCSDLTHNRVIDARVRTVSDNSNDALSFVSYDTMVEEMSSRVRFDFREEYRKTFSRENLLSAFVQGICQNQIEVVHDNDAHRPTWYRIVYRMFTSKATNSVILMSYWLNIDAEKCKELALLEVAKRDSLTGLYNKKYTEMLIDEYLSEQKFRGESCAFLMLDIDNFKDVNDSVGHAVGDTIISEVAESLSNLFRGTDVIGRIGGDEFVVFMKNVISNNAIYNKALDITKSFKDTATSYEIPIGLTVSIGIAFVDDEDSSYAKLYRQADTALLMSKGKGKNTVTVFQQEVMEESGDQKNEEQIDIPCIKYKGTLREQLPKHILEILSATDNVEHAVQTTLGVIGRYYNVSRVYILEFTADGSYSNNTFEWCNVGIEPQKEQLQNIPLDVLAEYTGILDEEGTYFMRSLDEAPPNLRVLLEPKGIKSMLHCAIREGNIVKGIIGFDECVQGRRLSSREELETLQYVSAILSIFLCRYRATLELATQKHDMWELIENLESCAYVIDYQSYKLLFINQKTQSIVPTVKTGDLCYAALCGLSEPCENCLLSEVRRIGARKTLGHVRNNALNLCSVATATEITWNGRKACFVNAIITSQDSENES